MKWSLGSACTRRAKHTRFARVMKSGSLLMLAAITLAAAVVHAPNAVAQAGQLIRPPQGQQPTRATLPRPPLQPLVRDVLPRSMPGVEALAALRVEVLAMVATQNGQSVESLTRLLTNDSSAWLDADGMVLFLDPPPPAEYLTSVPPGPALFSYSQTFLLHSRPGSKRVLFLDFDGYDLPAGTEWRGGAPYAALPYDSDGDGSTFSADEQAVIQSIWQRVSEDFAPFDIDVTTQDPGYDAINRSDDLDMVFGGRVVITNSPDVDFCGGRCGGVSYLGNVDNTGVGHDTHQPSWSFTSGAGLGAKTLAEVTSHEFGHAVGLLHDGRAGVDEYYLGHGMWAPIMGAGYVQPVTQWSSGEYTNASNLEDDFAVVVSNTVGLVPDESPGYTVAVVDLIPGGTGLVGVDPAWDGDSWRYVAPCTGTYTFTVNPAATSPNMICQFQIYGPGGVFLDAVNSQPVRVSDDLATGMGATITRLLDGGSAYTLAVLPIGYETPSTGWSAYASVGRYTLDVTPPCATSIPPNCRFASSVVAFSSEYTSVNWSAQQALGPPNVYPSYGDIPQAWASAGSDGQSEFLVLGFTDPAPINFVNVYETFNPGAIQAIWVRNPYTGLFQPVWTGAPAAAPAEARLFTATFPVTPFPVSEIAIDVASDLVGDWNEIDAVGIGYRDLAAESQWASRVVDFSSEFSPLAWSAQQALGPPDLFPQYGDAASAWASETQDGQREFLDLAFATPSPINYVNVVETYSPGALDKVSVKNPNTGLFEQVWSGTAAPAPPVSRILTVSFPETRFLVSEVRLDFDSPAVTGWNEVDAVGIGRCACQSSLVDVPGPASTPVATALEWARPNPFTTSTGIGFSLARGGWAKVEVFNLLGQRVTSLLDRAVQAGRHDVRWDGRDAGGRTVAEGVYYLRLQADGLDETRKVVKIQ